MSVWGGEMDKIIAIIRADVTDMPPGVRGAERGIRDGSKLDDAELPHLFVFNPAYSVSPTIFNQREVTKEYNCELWVTKTQEELAVLLDAFIGSFDADRDLTVTVHSVFISQAIILESEDDTARKVLAFTIQTRMDEG